ncbi:MAG: UDP-3-O-(3-hydroxymyristoyl)glucosamine N-acyltransferase [Deltaproteobacteria bacterium]|nr:UDP-3-O-(3-hydroxymyristoyl)glucosamine N-acyltransferase [Deltaproteobacteria bacterium]MBW2359773.1 UDP-3-O-(3-hydroxymyristoyl)glucosamine N-acyltransferase [Deltaproteobacteria bacterium]
MRLAELAERLGREIEGNGDVALAGVASLAEAGLGDLAFVRSPRFADQLAATRAAAVIAAADVETGSLPTLRSPHPGLDFARAARLLEPSPPRVPGVHPSAVLGPGAEVAADVCIGPLCVLGCGARVGAGSVLHANVTLYPGVEVGRDCTLHASCVLREETRLGDRVTVHAGAVLGSEGFGFVANERGRWEATPQRGRVVVEDDVEIGANTVIDRAAFGETRLRRGAKLDAGVIVGHGCDIGEDALVGAQAGLAGSVRLGVGALVMPQAGIVDHVTIGEGAYVGPRSGVVSDVPAGARVLGAPHQALPRQRRIWVALRRLPELLRRVRALERRVGGDEE